MKKILLGISALSVAAAVMLQSGVCAQDAKAAEQTKTLPNMSVKKMDKDSDGKVTPEEFKESWVIIFKKMDKNKDGKISKDDRIARADAMIAEMDVDKDGFISHEEFGASKGAAKAGSVKADPKKTRMENVDGDTDKSVNHDEMLAFQDYIFVIIDTDKDGKLDSDELKAYLIDEFKKEDKDTDGVVTMQEFMSVYAP